MIERFFEIQKNNFLDTVCGDKASPAQRKAMEIAFFSGAITAVGIMTELTTRMPDEMALIEIARLVQHLNDFRPAPAPKPSDETPHA